MAQKVAIHQDNARRYTSWKWPPRNSDNSNGRLYRTHHIVHTWRQRVITFSSIIKIPDSRMRCVLFREMRALNWWLIYIALVFHWGCEFMQKWKLPKNSSYDCRPRSSFTDSNIPEARDLSQNDGQFNVDEVAPAVAIIHGDSHEIIKKPRNYKTLWVRKFFLSVSLRPFRRRLVYIERVRLNEVASHWLRCSGQF